MLYHIYFQHYIGLHFIVRFKICETLIQYILPARVTIGCNQEEYIP